MERVNANSLPTNFGDNLTLEKVYLCEFQRVQKYISFIGF